MRRRALDLRRQRALSRYYVDAGAGGLAVGVHTTQFAIREAGLYEPVLRDRGRGRRAGPGGRWSWSPAWSGRTEQALREARVARGLGYHAGLLSLAALQGASEDELIAHCERVAAEIPLVGFYLQPAVGGVVLSAELLAPLRRDRQRGRDQDRAVQPLPHAGRDPRRGRGGRRAAHHAADRQRRPHRRRPAHAVHLPPRRRAGHGADHRRPARPLVRLDAKRRSSWSPASARRRRRRRDRPGAARPSTRRSPTATPRSSTPPTISPAASPAATRCCAARACSRAPGASTRTRA